MQTGLFAAGAALWAVVASRRAMKRPRSFFRDEVRTRLKREEIVAGGAENLLVSRCDAWLTGQRCVEVER
jgi:hypothetical protein